MKKLSLCMIVKNEEDSIKSVLQNANLFADEIIIVDTGSTDNTKKIAQSFTDKVFDFEWCDDFSKARNFSFDKASFEYIIWLDADDIIGQDSIEEIIKWKKGEEECDIVMCQYLMNNDSSLSFYRERIIKNSKRLRWRDRVHETITLSGKVVYNENIKINHNKKINKNKSRNLNIYQKMIENNEVFTPRSQFYYARELYFNEKYEEAIHAFSKFLAEGKGWVENNIDACLTMAKCYHIKKEYDQALSILFGSFVYDLPRSEILCEIGNIYLEVKDYKKAIFWFELALNQKPNFQSGGFIDYDSYTFIPAIQLCVSYSMLEDNERAYKFHLMAKEFKPQDSRVEYNESYFNNLFEKK